MQDPTEFLLRDTTGPAGVASYSFPRPGFGGDEAGRRECALIFASLGIAPDWIRSRTHPGDRLFRELADEVDAVRPGLPGGEG